MKTGEVIASLLPIRERALRRALPAVLGAVVALVLLADQAGAHTVVRPGGSRPADLQVYTLTVPNEREVATDEVSLQVPAEIDFLLVDDAPGWRIELERRGGGIAVVRWRGGSINPDFYGTLRFIARNPVRQGVLEWKINQHYKDGSTVRWIGPPGSETPASRTQVSETASPVDVVSVHGETQSPAAPSPAASTESATKATTDERDELTLALAIAGLGIGLVALFLTLRSRRR